MALRHLQRISRSCGQPVAIRALIMPDSLGGQQQQRQMSDYKSPHKVVSPCVTIYKWPVAALTSITNRVTGVGLWVGVSGIGLMSLTGDVDTVVEAVKASPLIVPAKLAVAFPLLFH